MKRIFLFTLLNFITIISFSQYHYDINLVSDEIKYRHYFIPPPILNYLGVPMDSIDFRGDRNHEWLNNDNNPIKIYTNTGISFDGELINDDIIMEVIPKGFAQPMHTDTMLSMGGVCFFTYTWLYFPINGRPAYTNYLDTIQIIKKESMQVIYEKVLYNNFPYHDISYGINFHKYYGYYNIIFDSAINVQGDYLIAYKYNPEHIYQFENQEKYYKYNIPLLVHTEAHAATQDTMYHHRIVTTAEYLKNSYRNQAYVYNYELGWKKYLEYMDAYNRGWYEHPFAFGGGEFGCPAEDERDFYTGDMVLFVIPDDVLDEEDLEIRAQSIASLEDRIKKDDYISVSPNPTKGNIIVSSPDIICHISIVNTMGQEVYRQECNQKEAYLNILSMPSGVYILHIKTQNGVVIKKVIRE